MKINKFGDCEPNAGPNLTTSSRSDLEMEKPEKIVDDRSMMQQPEKKDFKSIFARRVKEKLETLGNIQITPPPVLVFVTDKHGSEGIENCTESSSDMVVVMNPRRSGAPASTTSWDGILPFDIVATNILPRLPVKSLASLRFVCKKWFFLTLDPRFAMEHLMVTEAAAADAESRCCTLVSSPSIMAATMLQQYNLIRLNGDGNGTDNTIIKKGHSLCFNFGNSRSCTLSNSVNGLVCVLCADHSESVSHPYLFNPTTRDALPLPDISTGESIWRPLGISLGFDASSGQYKVVYFYQKKTPPNGSTIMYVLTVGSQEWRCVGEISATFNQETACYVNGALHWLFNEGDIIVYQLILAFDVKDETTRFIPLRWKSITLGFWYSSLALRSFGGHLFLVREPIYVKGVRSNRCVYLRMWKLEDYTNCIWKRSYSINMSCFLKDKSRVDDDIHVVDAACGKVLVQSGERLYSYDVRSKTLNLITERLPSERYTISTNYLDVLVESLISPNNLHWSSVLKD